MAETDVMADGADAFGKTVLYLDFNSFVTAAGLGNVQNVIANSGSGGTGGTNISSVYSANIFDVHEVPLHVITRPIPVTYYDEDKVRVIVELLQFHEWKAQEEEIQPSMQVRNMYMLKKAYRQMYKDLLQLSGWLDQVQGTRLLRYKVKEAARVVLLVISIPDNYFFARIQTSENLMASFPTVNSKGILYKHVQHFVQSVTENPNTKDQVAPIDILWVKGTEGGNYYFSFGGNHRLDANYRLGLTTNRAKVVPSAAAVLPFYLGLSTPKLN